MKQKEKLIEKIKDLDSKLVSLNHEMDVEVFDLYPSSLINKFYSILDSLPNRVLAKIIRDAKAEVKVELLRFKELKEEKKNMEEE
tara:strand:- start:42 stop:296 length:255 start_codon:yes stop_codon:yes gene_type:complete